MSRREQSYGCKEAKEYWKSAYEKSFERKGLPRDLTPLRYPGGKGSLKYFLANILAFNDLQGKTLIEPFCGGAGASIPLLVTGAIERLYLNDADPAIAAFWHSLFFDTSAFVNLVNSVPVTVEEWYRWREVLQCRDSSSQLELGFAAFYMNRCNHSGLLNGGPIGGFDQTGNYKIDCRFNRKVLINRIETIASFRDRVFISDLDACVLLSTVPSHHMDEALIFIDPPYVVQGKNLYKGTVFDEVKHRELADYIKPKDWRWVITYDDHPLIHNLYAERTLGVLELSYIMQQAKIGRELLVASSHCRIPLPASSAVVCSPEDVEFNIKLEARQKSG